MIFFLFFGFVAVLVCGGAIIGFVLALYALRPDRLSELLPLLDNSRDKTQLQNTAVIGLLLAAIFEVPRFFRIQNIEDARHYTGLPVLASVPPLLSNAEKSWIARSYWLKLAGGVAASLGVIPLIILLLQTTHILDKIVT